MGSVSGRWKSLSVPRRFVGDLLHASRRVPVVTFERRADVAPVLAARRLLIRPPAWTVLLAKAFAVVAAAGTAARVPAAPLAAPVGGGREPRVRRGRARLRRRAGRLLRDPQGTGQEAALAPGREAGGVADEAGRGSLPVPAAAHVLATAAAGAPVPVVVRDRVVGAGDGPQLRDVRREPHRASGRDRDEPHRPAHDQPELRVNSTGWNGRSAVALRPPGDGRHAGRAGAGGVGRGLANRDRGGTGGDGRRFSRHSRRPRQSHDPSANTLLTFWKEC